jgi:hypothetical protein
LKQIHPDPQIFKGFAITLQDLGTGNRLKKTLISRRQQSFSCLNYSQFFAETRVSLPLSNKPVSSPCPELYEFR